MSDKFHFQISRKYLMINSLVILLGLTVASVFLRLTGEELLQSFTEHLEEYFVFPNIFRIVLLVLQECVWLLLIIAFSRVPYGKIALVLILFYKGFSIGVIASVFCIEYGTLGLKYILLLLLPQNLLYIISLCITTQIALEISSNTIHRGRHGKIIQTDPRAYMFCFLLTALAALIESIGIPWIHQTLF